MKIEKALEHQKWRLQNGKPTERDIEAYNSILRWKKTQEKRNTKQNENFAKLWVHQLILLSDTKMYSGERCIQVIDEILRKPVYEWVVLLKEKLSIMRFKAVLSDNGVNIPKDVFNDTQLTLAMSNALKGRERLLAKVLKQEVSLKNTIIFVEEQINRSINEYEKS